jgi:RNA methyltransferase, TrmH family
MPPESIVRSRQNPVYKQIRSLLRRDRRHQERAFLVEGRRFIADAMATGATPSLIALAESLAIDSDTTWLSNSPVRILDDQLFASLTDTVTSQGMLAIFPMPTFLAAVSRVPFIFIADGIQDPGNLGTLIRSAAGAGATQVVALPGTVDPWAPKTVRAAAGSHFLVPIASLSSTELLQTLPSEVTLVAAEASGGRRYDEYDMSGPLAVIVGSEGNGLSAPIVELDPLRVSIPLEADLESLNAGVAGSIIMFEASRQRRSKANRAKTPHSI